MNVKRLFDGLEYEWITKERCDCINGVTHIAEEIKEGDCFVCLHCNEFGMSNIKLAIKNGAKLVVADKYIRVLSSIPVIKTSDIRQAYSIMAKNYYAKAVDKMLMIAVVGTNGKSTTSYLIWSVLTKNNVMCGLIGTGFYMVGDKKFKSDMTTPDPMQLHCILNIMANCGVKIVVMEVSAHAIYYKKVVGIKYKIAVFTNLSQDHLDFFQSMQKLEDVKHSFFLNGFSEISLINVDDKSGASLAKKMMLPNITYGINCLADIVGKEVLCDESGLKFKMNILQDDTTIESGLFGIFNVYNLIACIIACKLCNLRLVGITNAIKQIKPLEGRGNVLQVRGVRYVIDYAHTPDSIKNILIELKKITKGKLLLVFGAGGNRDYDKRSKMGTIAAEYADVVIITSDNPRFEEACDIMQDIYKGVLLDNSLNAKKIINKNVFLIENRRQATQKAIDMALPTDTILIAGKGCEEYMEKKGKKYPYSDKATIEEILKVKWK